MNSDIHTLVVWIRVVAVIASLCSTSLPILYSTFPWRTRTLGRLFMLLAVNMALAVDLSTMFLFWRPTSTVIRFWINGTILTLIAISTLLLTIFMWRLKHSSQKKGRSTNAVKR
jgi:hypothetical protein